MNLLSIFVTFLAYALFVAMYNTGTTDDAPDFPTFNAPDVAFRDIPDSCGGFTDCIEFVGNIIINVVLGVIYLVLLIVEILRVLVALLVLLASSAFTGIDGTPPWLNVLILGIFGISTVIIIYKSVRKGDTDSA